jgi:hypothetical protein
MPAEYVDIAYAILEALMIRLGRTDLPDLHVHTHLNPFDPKLDELFQGKEDDLWLEFLSSHEAFQNVIRLSTGTLGANFFLVPYMAMPPFWSVIEDYALTVAMALLGPMSTVLENRLLPFSRLDPAIGPQKEQLETRMRCIDAELPLLIERHPIPRGAQLRSPLDWLMSNWLSSLSKGVLTRVEQIRLLRVLYLFGIPEHNAARKLAKIAQFTTVRECAIVDFLNSFIDTATIYDSSLDRFKSGPGTLDFWWVPVARMAEVVRSVSVLARVRKAFSNTRFVTRPFPRWNDAPAWWSDPMDKVLFNLSAYYGFLYFSEFVRFFPRTTAVGKDPDIRGWKAIELRKLTPYIEETGTYLEFLFPISVRMRRLEALVRFIGTTTGKG